MAVIETWFDQDLQKPVAVHYLDGSLFSHNGNGNLVGVHVFQNGEPVTLSGAVTGYVVTTSGETVPCTGTRSGNSASIMIPAAAYQPGNVFVSIFLTDGNDVTTLAAMSTNVLQTRTGNQVDPGSVVSDWTDTINAAMQAVEDAVDDLENIVAVPYASITFPVPVGKYTIQNSNLYRCITPIATSETFTAAHWTQVRLGDDVSDLKSALNDKSVADSAITGNLPGVWKKGYYLTPAVGSAVTYTEATQLNCTTFAVSEGDTVTLDATGYSGNSRLYVFVDSNGKALNKCESGLSGKRTITAPANAVMVAINNRLYDSSGNPIQATGYYAYKNTSINDRVVAEETYGIHANTANSPSLSANGDLNDYTTPGEYRVLNATTAGTISNSPFKTAGYRLIVYASTSNSNLHQYIIPANIDTIYARTYKGSTWSSWRNIIPIQLQSTSNTDDKSSTIRSDLLSYGRCDLGTGNFYVSGINMPDGTTLRGSGKATRIILMDSVSTGSAIKMGSHCTIENVSIVGSLTPIEFTEGDITSIHIGTRHGILWLGDATANDSTANAHFEGTISNVYISGFTGGGITCENTGYGTDAGINAVNCQISNCGAGINVSYWSEFSRFTNINCNGCYYGVINNGGNNIFSACNFSSNLVGFYTNGNENKAVLYDGTSATVRNGGHGSAVGCVINHTGGNTGYSVYIASLDSGWTFDGCQIFYGKIHLRYSSYIMFSNMNFGNNIEITIYTPSTYIFDMCYFRDNLKADVYNANTGEKWPDSSYDSDGNLQRAKFINCFKGNGTAQTLLDATHYES